MAGKITREKKTVQSMIEIYCAGKHGQAEGLCLSCRELLEYSHHRLDGCPFQEEKSTCANCLVHCYKPDMRSRIHEVMRYSGPRMAKKHPLSALLHLIAGLRRPKTLAEVKRR